MANHLFMTDAEIAKEIGIDTQAFKEKATVLEREGFPMPDPLFDRRRYWPACRAFLDKRYGLLSQSVSSGNPAQRDGEEKW